MLVQPRRRVRACFELSRALLPDLKMTCAPLTALIGGMEGAPGNAVERHGDPSL